MEIISIVISVLALCVSIVAVRQNTSKIKLTINNKKTEKAIIQVSTARGVVRKKVEFALYDADFDTGENAEIEKFKKSL